MISTVKLWREKKERYTRLGEVGRVVSWTKIIEPPASFGQMSYWVVMVEFKPKQRLVGQLVETREPRMGERVRGVLRRLRQPEASELIEYGLKFKYV
jgi:uncharacterized OB-fold protein